MIIGIGLDIVHVSRLTHWLENPNLCARYFHPLELDAVYARGVNSVLSLASRFAAKEAFVKAMGTGFAGLRLRDIRVENKKSGQPQLILEGKALERSSQIGVNRIHLSLTYEKNWAAAQVILEAFNG